MGYILVLSPIRLDDKAGLTVIITMDWQFSPVHPPRTVDY